MNLDEEVEAPPKGITTAHYIKFINELFDVMDRDETMKEYYWVMGNATIQESLPMQRKIEIRGYKCIYLPPYSPELNSLSSFNI